MRNYLLAVLFGALVYTVGVALMDEGFYPIGSVVFSAIIAAIVLGAKALVRLVLPDLNPQSLALATALVLLPFILVTALSLSPEHLSNGRLAFFTFWCVYLWALELGLFWPALVPKALKDLL
ncbi:MAG TPA: hypothetical protein VFB32_13525 [Rudaea sp.]|nr:hypothetical protein [Rudaea sp.]